MSTGGRHPVGDSRVLDGDVEQEVSSKRGVQERGCWRRLREPVPHREQGRRRSAAHLRGLAARGAAPRETAGEAGRPVPEGSGEG